MATKSVIRSNSKRKHYIVVYKGDDAIAQGYADDVAKELHIAYSTLSYMMSPAYKKRVNKLLDIILGMTQLQPLNIIIVQPQRFPDILGKYMVVVNMNTSENNA